MSGQRERQLTALRDAPGALLVVDVQRSFGDPAYLGEYGLGPAELDAVARAVDECARLVARAREAGVPVVWIELETTDDDLWGASSWLHTGDATVPLPDAPCVAGTAGAEWYTLAPAPGEARVVKHRYSGFVGTGLDVVLAELGTGWVAVAGLTTECCVAATAFDAFQRDLPVVVPSDATAAYDGAVHAAALHALALNAALVMPTAELEALWAS